MHGGLYHYYIDQNDAICLCVSQNITNKFCENFMSEYIINGLGLLMLKQKFDAAAR